MLLCDPSSVNEFRSFRFRARDEAASMESLYKFLVKSAQLHYMLRRSREALP